MKASLLRRLFPLWTVVTLLVCLGNTFAISLFAAENPPREWQSYDESAELEQQQQHANARMQFKLINSRVRDKNALWQEFTLDLEKFTELQYQALAPLILEQNIASIQQSVKAGLLSYEQLVLFYIYRIKQIEIDNDRSLNAVIALNPDVVNQARELDNRRLNGSLTVELQSITGMPILLKDNIGTKGMATTAGAIALLGNSVEDAFIVKRLKQQDGLILGKANLSEWAYFFCQSCPLGYSAVGGQTLNPYGRKQFESGGSSSGSAVAVAANLAVAAVGSETSGSILSPAAANSVVGLKPTTGLLSRSGIVPISQSLDTAGPITRSVEDAVILFNAMAAYDESDSAMPLLADGFELSIPAQTESGASVRLGIINSLSGDDLYGRATLILKSENTVLVDVELTTPELEGFSEFLGAEMRRDLAEYLQTWGAQDLPIDSVESLQRYNRQDLELRAPYGQELVDSMVVSSLDEEELLVLRNTLRNRARRYLDEIFQVQQLDALASIDNYHAALAALANYPAITVPMGYTDSGEPVGLTLFAPPFADQQLVDLASQYQQLSTARVPPPNYP